MWSRVTEGYGALPACGLINRSKSETQGQLSRRGGAIRARLGLLFLGLTGQVSLTSLANLLPVSTTSALPVAKFATGVVDTDGKFATGVVDRGGKFAGDVVDTSGAP